MMSWTLSQELILLIGYEVEIVQMTVKGKQSTMTATLLSYNAASEEMMLLFNNGERVLVSTVGEKFQIKRVTS